MACALSLLVLALLSLPALAVPPGTVIDNRADGMYVSAGGAETFINSNTVSIETVEVRTPSELDFLSYTPGGESGAQMVTLCQGSYSVDGTDTNLSPIDCYPPVEPGTPIPLVPTAFLHQGDPLCMSLEDPDQNRDPASADSVMVTLIVGDDRERLLLVETGPDTGVFTACIPSVGGDSPQMYDGLLTVAPDDVVEGSYVDALDPSDVSTVSVLVDPRGLVFDSATGGAVNGAKVTLVNADTGQPAEVFGDDGTSTFPPTVTSGGSVTDGSGRVYTFPSGMYRFPLVAPGNYRLEVIPPEGYGTPSTVDTNTLQALPGGPFRIAEPGSRGEDFTVSEGFMVQVDIPIDPVEEGLFVSKRVADDVAARGDFLEYRVDVTNGSDGAVGDITVTDRLPRGFRYQAGSLRVDGAYGQEPEISSDGRILTVNVGGLESGETVEMRYVVEISAGARTGENRNTAFASGGGLVSNTARATVVVKEDLFQSKAFIVGRVTLTDPGSDNPEGRKGVPGVRLYTEDGTYVVTDVEGRYHIEGVEPGVHVIQMDTESLPEGFIPVLAERNTRFAGSADSRFVEVQGGTLWRADFYLAPMDDPEGTLKFALEGKAGRNGLDCAVSLSGDGVPVTGRRLTVMLPEGSAYVSGSSTLDGKPAPEPRVTANYLTFCLDDRDGDWSERLGFSFDPGAVSAGDVKAVLGFDTPAEKGRRTPPLALTFNGEGAFGARADCEMATKGVRPGLEAKEGTEGEGKGASIPEFGKAWVEKASPGVEWLWPEEAHVPPIPSVKLAIKHTPAQKVRLYLNGSEVSPLNADGMVKNKAATVAVSRWRGVDVKDGDNLFEAVILDRSGNEAARMRRTIHYSTSPVKAVFDQGLSRLVADGRTPPVVAVRLTDREGFPARAGVIGTFTVAPPYEAWEKIEAFRKDPLSGSEFDRPRYEVSDGGIAYVRLQPTTRTGEVVLRFDLDGREKEVRAWLSPVQRDWLLVGLAEGTLGYSTLDGHMENIGDAGLEDDLYSDGRVAFFAKGMVRGKWLLTLAYDSDKATDEESLYRTIDPDSYYTLYGDASQQQYEATSSRSKLFVKVEREQFYALFGDYDTGLTVTELSRYSRSMSGFKSELHTDKYGFSVFAAETDQSFVKDEIRGDGTSGPYRLSRENLVQNSEKIVIEVRDRFRSELVLSTRPLTRHIDYDIDYDDGTIYFREPIFSKDSNFDPIYIVADYETWDSGEEAWQYGGRGSLKLMEGRLEVGGTYIHEEVEDDEGDLTGVDVTFEVDENTTVKAEYARTDRDDGDVNLEDEAYLVEVEYRDDKVDGTAYFREQGGDFGLGQQSVSESGTRKVGVDVSYRASERVTVDGQVYRHHDLETGDERDVAEVEATFKEKNYLLRAGLRHAEDRIEGGETERSEQVTLGVTTTVLDGKVTLRADHEQSIGGDDDNEDFPTRTTLGADYRLDEKTSFFVEHEFRWEDDGDGQGSRFGFKTRPWDGGELVSALERDTVENGSRLFASMGLKQKWRLSEKWSLDAGLDHNWTVDGPGGDSDDEDFTSLSMGLEYREGDWNWNMRAEYRDGESGEKWNLKTGVYGEPKEGLGLSASLSLTDETDDDEGDRTEADLSLACAYRPENSKWILFDRLDLVYEEDGQGDFPYDEWKVVNNLNANYRPSDDLQLALQYGLKYVDTDIDGEEYDGFHHLLGFEARYDLDEKWDIGIHAKALYSANSGQTDYSTGLSVGHNVFEDAWLSLGYNFQGFEDDDFSQGNYTAQGVYLQLKIKVDGNSLKKLFK